MRNEPNNKRMRAPPRSWLAAFCAAMLFLPAAVSFAAPACLFDPLHALAFSLPPGRWEVAEGFGDQIATFRGNGEAEIQLVWLGKTKRQEILRRPLSFLPRLWSDVRVMQKAREEGMSGADISFLLRARSALRDEFGAAVLFHPMDGGVMRIACRAPPDRAAETPFLCRSIASGVQKLPAMALDQGGGEGELLPSPEGISKARDQAISKPGDPQLLSAYLDEGAAFARLDGRGGCSASLARRRPVVKGGMERLLDRARSLESEGSPASAELIYQQMAKGPDGFFPRLFLARQALARGEAAAAEKLLPRNPSGSQLAAALFLWRARLEGDRAAVRRAAEELGDDPCGESGALALYQLGLILREEEPAEAERLFEAAIRADPSQIPSYLAIGELLLDLGRGREAALSRLSALLARAPRTEEVQRLRLRIGELRSGGGREAGVTGRH